MKNKPFLVGFCLAFLAAYFFWSVGQHYYIVAGNFQEHLVKRKQNLLDAMNLGFSLLRADLPLDVKRRFSDLQARGELDFYVLNAPGDKGFWSSQNGEFPKLTVIPENRNKLLEDPTRIYATVMVKDYTLTAGFQRTETWQYLWEYLILNKRYFMADLLMVIGLTTATLLYFAQDILAILSLVQSSKRKREFGKIRSKSRESEIIIRGLSSYEESITHLQDANQQLNAQVLSALKSELRSGRTPPYEFGCTLVRTDINNFSAIFSAYPVESFMALINEFFEEATHLIGRYGGYVYEFIGDEVIFYFKDEECTNSAAMAISAIRDINEIATRLNARALVELGYPFVVKSSMAAGKLRFGKQVGNFSLAGTVLIETVRWLNHVTDKNENSVVFGESLARDLGFLIEWHLGPEVQLKGIAGSRRLCTYQGHKPLSFILSPILSPPSPPASLSPAKTPQSSDLKLISFYRGDAHLLDIFRHLRSLVVSGRFADFLEITEVIKSFSVTNTANALRTEWLGLLGDLQAVNASAIRADERSLQHCLSSALILAIHILDRQSFDAASRSLLRAFLSSAEPRVVANALDVLTYFDESGEEALPYNLSKEKNNRIVSNAIIKQSLTTLSRKSCRKLAQMLRSQDLAKVASALFALGEIAAHHKRHNRVYFNTHLPLQRLLNQIEPLNAASDPRVQRQWQAVKSKLQLADSDHNTPKSPGPSTLSAAS